MASQQKFIQAPVDVIVVAENVRRDVGDIAELADSIRAHGVLEPIVCCPSADGKRVELLMGQRRLAAARSVGLETIPTILRPRPSDRDRILMQLAENLAREEMSPIDEGIAFQELVQLQVPKSDIVRAIHRTHKYVQDRLRLLELPDCVRMAVDLGYVRVAAALEFPRALLDRREAIARLAKVIRGGDKALRDWITDEMSALAGTAVTNTREGTVGRSMVRVIPVPPDAYERAKKLARQAGMGLGDWTAARIRSASS